MNSLGHIPAVVNGFGTSASFAYEAGRGGEDAFSSLPCLYRPGHKAFPFAYSLHVVENWSCGVACKYEIAVHAMDEEFRIAIYRRGWWNGFLRRCERLRDYGTTVDTSSVWRVP